MFGKEGYYEITNSSIWSITPEENDNKIYNVNFNTADDGACPTVAKIASIKEGVMGGSSVLALYLGKLNLTYTDTGMSDGWIYGVTNLKVFEHPRTTINRYDKAAILPGRNNLNLETLYLPENCEEVSGATVDSNGGGNNTSLKNVIIRNKTKNIIIDTRWVASPKSWNPTEINLYFPTEELKNYYENLYQTGTESTWYKDSGNFAEGQTVNFLVGDEPVAPSYKDPAFSSFTAKNEKINIKPNTANDDGLELGSFSITNFGNIDPSALKLGTKIISWNATTAVQDGLKLEIADQGSGNYKVIAKWANNAFTTEEVISFQYEITNNDSKVVSSDETTYTITVSNDTPVEPTTNNNLPAIIGGTVGGILALVIIAIIIAVVVKKRKQ